MCPKAPILYISKCFEKNRDFMDSNSNLEKFKSLQNSFRSLVEFTKQNCKVSQKGHISETYDSVTERNFDSF